MGVQILRGHYFLNEFGDTQFFCRFAILIWQATLCENFIKSVYFLQKLKMTRERPWGCNFTVYTILAHWCTEN